MTKKSKNKNEKPETEYTSQAPWAEMGTDVKPNTSSNKMLKAAGLDWEVGKQPIYTMVEDEPQEIKGKHALTRLSDNQVLDIVGNHYKPIQNRTAFKFFKDYVEAGDSKIETIGSFQDGRITWALSNLGIEFTLKGGDTVKGYLLLMSPHKQGKSFVVKLTSVRVRCNNTLTMALKENTPEFRMAHRREFDEFAITSAKEVLDSARDTFNDFRAVAEQLKKIKLERDEVIELLAPVYQPKAKELTDETLSPRMNQLLDIYQNAPGADPGTGWGVLNAVTYYSDHVAARTADKRMANAWIGKSATQKEKVLDLLMAA